MGASLKEAFEPKSAHPPTPACAFRRILLQALLPATLQEMAFFEIFCAIVYKSHSATRAGTQPSRPDQMLEPPTPLEKEYAANV